MPGCHSGARRSGALSRRRHQLEGMMFRTPPRHEAEEPADQDFPAEAFEVTADQSGDESRAPAPQYRAVAQVDDVLALLDAPTGDVPDALVPRTVQVPRPAYARKLVGG